jgi:hypothetical protein
MTGMTEVALILLDPILLILGLALLNWIFRPPHYEDIDIILMLVCLVLMFFFASWGAALNLGVEHL